MTSSDLLLAAVRAAPRRHAAPALPADAASACRQGPAAALAWAIECARVAQDDGAVATPEAMQAFCAALDTLVRQALAEDGGDAAFQARVLRAHEAQVDEYERLAAQAGADRRAVRAGVDALAHPGKTQRLSPGPRRASLERLHELASEGAWSALREAAAQDAALAHLVAQPALERLERGNALRAEPAVQAYLALLARAGPLAGSGEAAARGRVAQRRGASAEALAVQAFTRIARRLDDAEGGEPRHRVVQGLHTPRTLPALAGAKDEWDVAIARRHDDGRADLLLLAEVKAAPAAALADLGRLRRGLRRLAQASAQETHAFRARPEDLHVRGASLRELAPPPAFDVPARVVYACVADDGAAVPLLSPASLELLLAEPATLSYAAQRMRGGAVPDAAAALAPVWAALTQAPRLRPVLHQRSAALAVVAALLHPDDLAAAVHTLAAA